MELITKLEKIEQDVAALSAHDLTHFRDWFDAFEAERFDRQIETDITAGKLDELSDAALADFRLGRALALRHYAMPVIRADNN